jgi:hypothetical protein
MVKEIVKWRPVIIGVVIVAVLYATADIISGVSLTLPSFLLVGIIVGYIINSSEKEGAINGAIMGLIGGIIVNGILVVIMMAQGYGDYLVSIISTTVIYIILEIIIAAAGGVLGTLIRAESIKYQETPE